MNTEPEREFVPCKTLWDHVRTVGKRLHRERPASFYLLFAIIGVLLLGAPLIHAQDQPQRFALYLSLFFVFFFAVMARAIVDAGEIVRRHLREQSELYRNTLGDAAFAGRLGQRVREQQEKE